MGSCFGLGRTLARHWFYRTQVRGGGAFRVGGEAQVEFSARSERQTGGFSFGQHNYLFGYGGLWPPHDNATGHIMQYKMHWKHFYCLVIGNESARFAGHGTRGGVGGGSVFKRMAAGARVSATVFTVDSLGCVVQFLGGSCDTKKTTRKDKYDTRPTH